MLNINELDICLMDDISHLSFQELRGLLLFLYTVKLV